MNILTFLAQATQPTQPPPWQYNPSQWFLPLIIVVMVFFLFSSSRAKKNEQKTRDDMLKNLKRGDRVMTAGGIYATVVDVRDADVVLKVDESNNTKIKFSREAIKRVVTDEDSAVSTK
ncbi:MAG: preprotein translocase subunit YajC [Tepidisphaeraceae bacterium]